MKKVLFIFLFVAFLATAFSAFAGDDHAAIEKLLEKGFEAFQKQDWDTAASLVTSDYMIILHNGERLSLEGIKTFFIDHITEHTIDISNVDIHVSGDASMAWASLDEKTSYKFDGEPVTESAIFTAIFVKEDDAWKLKLEHRAVVQPPPAKD